MSKKDRIIWHIKDNVNRLYLVSVFVCVLYASLYVITVGVERNRQKVTVNIHDCNTAFQKEFYIKDETHLKSVFETKRDFANVNKIVVKEISPANYVENITLDEYFREKNKFYGIILLIFTVIFLFFLIIFIINTTDIFLSAFEIIFSKK